VTSFAGNVFCPLKIWNVYPAVILPTSATIEPLDFAGSHALLAVGTTFGTGNVRLSRIVNVVVKEHPASGEALSRTRTVYVPPVISCAVSLLRPVVLPTFVPKGIVVPLPSNQSMVKSVTGSPPLISIVIDPFGVTPGQFVLS